MRSNGNTVPDTKLSAMLGVVRRELHMTTSEAAKICGRSQELVSNMEVGIVRMGEGPTRVLLLHYLQELGAPQPEGQLSLGQLVEALAVAVLVRRARQAAELLAGAESGADAVVRAVCLQGLHPERLDGKVVRRLRYRLAAEERKRVEARATD